MVVEFVIVEKLQSIVLYEGFSIISEAKLEIIFKKHDKS